MELLILLASRPGALVAREEIAARFWGDDVFVDVDSSINRIVAKLRLALHDDPARPRFIETVVGKGYRLITRLDPPIRSIAVLPFCNPGQSTDENQLADSITGTLITQLASIPSLRVVPRRSVDRFASTTQPLQEVARELEVDAIVQGKVAADAQNVHVTAKLEQFSYLYSEPVAAVSDVIPAFVRREELERRGDKGQHLIERSWSRGAEERF
jgi:DNA-binding winged helix-turn-helix (wHTH) protein